MNASAECQSGLVIAFVCIWMCEITAAALYLFSRCF